MALISAPPPCQMELCFVSQLEPTRMRWKNDQAHNNSVTRETNVQECNSVKSMFVPTTMERRKRPQWVCFSVVRVSLVVCLFAVTVGILQKSITHSSRLLVAPLSWAYLLTRNLGLSCTSARVLVSSTNRWAKASAHKHKVPPTLNSTISPVRTVPCMWVIANGLGSLSL